MKLKDLVHLLKNAAEQGACKALAESGQLQDQLTKAEAYRLYGRGNVDRWISEGLICPTTRNGKIFTIDPSANEHIMQFAFEGHWVSDLSSFITQTPGEIVIEAIEDSEVLLLPHHELELLFVRIPALEKFFRHLYQMAYVALQKRVNIRDSTTAKERYKELIAKHPNIAKRVPLLYIASYLGNTPESLSRVRATMAK
ncbi:hypothetical protein QG516_03790 [Pedobacter gandavensis]|uniref:Crp/Fnr family transcriptional regulator n=1 Tax=Pedobacter gandavensis TaxID=2679963 RepID=UPI00247841CB|nr:hypothetical protein [Pedobacter gandavensis]WGQ10775.1 hypothetical protein QG516_03790 [Pedobacter gandavensis]